MKPNVPNLVVKYRVETVADKSRQCSAYEFRPAMRNSAVLQLVRMLASGIEGRQVAHTSNSPARRMRADEQRVRVASRPKGDGKKGSRSSGTDFGSQAVGT